MLSNRIPAVTDPTGKRFRNKGICDIPQHFRIPGNKMRREEIKEIEVAEQKFYAVAGAHADYDFGPVLVSLWGRNLTNTHYNTFAVASSAVGGTHYFAQRATPIQVGLDVNIHF